MTPATGTKIEKPKFLSSWTAATLIGNLHHIDSQQDTRASAMIGISTFLIAFVTPRLVDELSIFTAGWILILIGALLAIVNCIVMLNPKVGSAHRRKNLFFPGSYYAQLSRREFVQQLDALLASDQGFKKHFIEELYDYGEVVEIRSKHLERAMKLFAMSVFTGTVLLVAFTFLV